MKLIFPKMNFTTNYRIEIDGLRAIAVLGVIIFHINSNYLIGGYYGVDVFFVISGYLITGILIKNIESNSFKMLDFWIRRVNRIIPLLLTVIITSILILPHFIFKPSFIQVLEDILPAIFSYFNFHAYFNFGDYWGQTADKSFFLHTWSLSLEEQFYLFYPFLLLILHKFIKSFLLPLSLITIASLGLFIYFLDLKTELVFYMLPFRAWELCLGGVVMCLHRNNFSNSDSGKNIFSIIGLLLIFIGYFFASETISYIAILPVFGTAILICFCKENTVVGKILTTKVLVHIGKLSYSLYLWHWPVIVLFKNLEYKFKDLNILYIYLLILSITYILSLLTYNFVENKTRYHKNTPKLVLVGLTTCFALIIFFKSTLFTNHYNSLYNQQTLKSTYYDVSPKKEIINKDNPRFYNTNFVKRLDINNEAYKNSGILQTINNETPKVLIMGDSHGTTWAETLVNVLETLQKSSSVYTTNGSRPFFNLKDINNQKQNKFFTKQQKVEFAKSIIGNIEKWDVELVIISCRWENLTTLDKSNFETFIEFLKTRNTKLLVINQPPLLSIFGDNNASQFISYLKIYPIKGFNTISINQDRIIKSNSYLNQLATKNENIIIFDVFEKLYEGNEVKITNNQDVLYFDDDHLSLAGTELFKDELKLIITNSLNKF